jgi:hypothetical protein
MLKKISRCYMTDAPKKTSCPSTSTKIKVRDSGFARKTHIATYFGSEYSSLREVDDLKIFDESNDSQPPKLVCVYAGSAFICENGSDELKVFWVSSDPLATNTIGDSRSGPMSAKRFQSEIMNKVRRLAGVSR